MNLGRDAPNLAARSEASKEAVGFSPRVEGEE